LPFTNEKEGGGRKEKIIGLVNLKCMVENRKGK